MREGIKVYTILRTAIDSDRGDFPPPDAVASFLSLEKAKAKLRGLVEETERSDTLNRNGTLGHAESRPEQAGFRRGLLGGLRGGQRNRPVLPPGNSHVRTERRAGGNGWKRYAPLNARFVRTASLTADGFARAGRNRAASEAATRNGNRRTGVPDERRPANCAYTAFVRNATGLCTT